MAAKVIPQPQVQRIMRLPEVMHLTGYSRSSIYNFMAEGSFPQAKKLGPRAIGWNSHSVLAWIDERLNSEVTA